MLETTRSKLSGIGLGDRNKTYKALNYVLDHPAALLGLAAVGVVIGVLWAPPSANPIDMIIAVATWALMAVLLVVGACGILLFASFAEITAEMLVDSMLPKDVQTDVKTAEAAEPVIEMTPEREGSLLSCIAPAVQWYCQQQERRGYPVTAREARLCWYAVTIDAITKFDVDFMDHEQKSYSVWSLTKKMPQYAPDQDAAQKEWEDYCAVLAEADGDLQEATVDELTTRYLVESLEMICDETGREDADDTAGLLVQACEMCTDTFLDRLEAAGIIK